MHGTAMFQDACSWNVNSLMGACEWVVIEVVVPHFAMSLLKQKMTIKSSRDDNKDGPCLPVLITAIWFPAPGPSNPHGPCSLVGAPWVSTLEVVVRSLHKKWTPDPALLMPTARDAALVICALVSASYYKWWGPKADIVPDGDPTEGADDDGPKSKVLLVIWHKYLPLGLLRLAELISQMSACFLRDTARARNVKQLRFNLLPAELKTFATHDAPGGVKLSPFECYQGDDFNGNFHWLEAKELVKVTHYCGRSTLPAQPARRERPPRRANAD